jgi:hypothetical protein
MRIKMSLLVIAVICLIFVFFSKNQLIHKKIPVKIIQTSESKLIQKTPAQVISDNLPEKTAVNENKTPLETFLPSQFYDADPVIETQLIIDNNRRCYQQLTQNKELIKYNQLAEIKLSSRQKSYFESYKKYCEELNELHPEFKLTDINSIKKQQRKMLATSQWGEIMTGEIDVSTLSDYEISHILKKNDVNILSQAPKYLKNYYQKIIHWDLEDVLQNHQYDYVNYIQYLAHQLYLCERGDDCSVTSTIMVRLCYQNSMSCGLDYPLFIKSNLTQGQQSDIKLALEYLRGQYQ